MGLFGRRAQSDSASRASGRAVPGGRAPKICDPKDLVVTLIPRDAFDGPAGYEVREPLPGLVAPITIDEGDGMRAQWGNLDKVGMDADAAYERSISNLSAMPVDLTAAEDSTEPGIYTRVHFLSAPDGFASGRIFLIDHMLRYSGEEFPDHGILLCVPNIFTMAVHVPRDAGVIGGMAKLMEVGRGEFQPELNGITPHVFLLLPDGRSVQCSHFTEGGTMAMDSTSGPLHAMLLKFGIINT